MTRHAGSKRSGNARPLLSPPTEEAPSRLRKTQLTRAHQYYPSAIGDQVTVVTYMEHKDGDEATYTMSPRTWGLDVSGVLGRVVALARVDC